MHLKLIYILHDKVDYIETERYNYQSRIQQRLDLRLQLQGTPCLHV